MTNPMPLNRDATDVVLAAARAIQDNDEANYLALITEAATDADALLDLWHAALTVVNLTVQTVTLVTGLPVDQVIDNTRTALHAAYFTQAPEDGTGPC